MVTASRLKPATTSLSYASHPYFGRFIVVFAIVALFALHQLSSHFHNATSGIKGKHDEHEEGVMGNYHDPFEGNRCVEEDKKDLKRQKKHKVATLSKTECECPDPLSPLPRKDENWRAFHDQIAQELTSIGPVDVAIVGDSITERFRGTAGVGSKDMPEIKQIFDKEFQKSKGGKLNGVALGASGDVTSESIWHLENGWMPNNFHPRIWLILIGTNDLGRMGCNKRSTITGILHIAEHIHKERPDASIILHGLLPRRDAGAQDYRTGLLWEKIMWINRELKNLCKLHKNWYYVEASNIFVNREKETGDMVLHKAFMWDGLHPTAPGYKRLAHRIAFSADFVLQKHTT